MAKSKRLHLPTTRYNCYEPKKTKSPFSKKFLLDEIEEVGKQSIIPIVHL
jgi:hypothetical protein